MIVEIILVTLSILIDRRYIKFLNSELAIIISVKDYDAIYKVVNDYVILSVKTSNRYQLQ